MSISDTTHEIRDRTEAPVVVDEPAVRVEEPRQHPLTYIALGLATVALILSIAALMRDTTPERIRVGNSDCVVVDMDADAPDALFCNTTNVPAP